MGRTACTEPKCLYNGALFLYVLNLSCKVYSDYVAYKTPVFKNLKVISVVKPTRCTNVSNLFYFGMTLYTFQTVFLSIIRSSRLYVQQQAYVKQILLYVQSSSGVQDCT